MNKFLILFLLILPQLILAQASVNGKVSAGDSVQINISSVTPVEFPLIEVLFRAENLAKYPYWGLEKEDLVVMENGMLCKVISLRHFSESEPINISIVIDHSGSMFGSFTDYLSYFDNDTTKVFEAFITGAMPDIESPLENAIAAVKGFLENFENEKDRIGLYAFDDTVDVQIKPTNDIASLETTLESLKPTGSTAFYDAVYLAIESLIEFEGINVVIALTDGQDNASKYKSADVISLSKKNEIPVYCIGLGDVVQDSLRLLADSTNGYYAYTKTSSSLDSIYDLLNRKILAYYLMTYDSPNWSSLDVERSLTIEFDLTDTYVTDNSLQFKLPDEVIKYLKEKEDQERKEFQYLVGGIAAGSIVILGLTVFLIRRARKKDLAILKVYPNPGKGDVTVDIELGSNESAKLIVLGSNGTEVFSESFSKSESIKLDLTLLTRGNYILYLQSEKEKSETKKYMKL